MDGRDTGTLPTGRTLSVRGDEVRRLRLQKGWSIEEFAAKAGCSAGTVQNMEKGANLYLATIRKAAKALGVEIWDLLADPGRDVADRPAASETGRRIRVSVILDIPSVGAFDESSELVALLRVLKEIIHSNAEIDIHGVTNSSVLIDMEMDEDDLLAMLEAFYDGRLDALGIAEIVFPLSWIHLMSRPRQEPEDFLDKVRDIWYGHGGFNSESVECKRDYRVRGPHKIFGPDAVSYVSFARKQSLPPRSMRVTAQPERSEVEAEGEDDQGQ